MNTLKIKFGFILLLTSIICHSQTYERTSLGIKINTQSVQTEVQFYSPEIVRILKTPEENSFEKKSLSVIKEPAKTEVEIFTERQNVILKSKALKVVLDTQTGKVSYFTLEDLPLFAEKDYGIQFTESIDNKAKTFNVRQAFLLDKDEAIYGLGQHQKGKMNQRFQKLTLIQTNMEICIPFFQSVKGYGVFWDNYSPTTFTDNLQETSFESSVSDCADYYFMYGQNPEGVIKQMRLLTGEAPMFPLWTFGYWQSKERYQSQDEIVGVIEKYRELNIPLDGIIQDWQYWGLDEAMWNSTEFGNPKFSNPKDMIDKIHALNAHAIISVWPNFGSKTKIFHELTEKKMLLDFMSYPPTPTSGVRNYDVYNQEARSIYWNYMNKNLFSLGIDGWWLDATEPEHTEVNEKDFDIPTNMGTFRKVRNAFPLMTVGGVYENQRKTTSDKRTFILTRSAFAGQQRFGATSWSGDIISSWEVLKNQISGGLNLSLCGIPYWNTDIGGFFTYQNFKNGVKDIAFQELYVRWVQFGAFTTMMRSHGTNTPREIYNFGQKGDWAYDAINKYINLRYRFLPYIYSTSWDITANSSSILRALVMDFNNDKKVWDINNEYLFGKSVLVCPVTESQYVTVGNDTAEIDFSEVKTHTIYLPKGSEWIDFWSGERLEGGQELNRETPIDIIPLYVKAGSIIPMGPFVQYSNEKDWSQLEIRIYKGANGKFSLYEDEKDNYNYEKGAYSIIDMIWDDQANELTIKDRKGSFSGMLTKRLFNIIIVEKNKGTGIEMTNKYTKIISYSGKNVRVKL
jgi:alpha-D-xyloside xylohydrolase